MTIFTVIQQAKRRDDVVDEYAELLRWQRRGMDLNWQEVNAAIMDKWSPAALRYIKERAWKLLG